MLRPFANPVAFCCMLLRVVGSCCVKFESSQTFSYEQMDATAPNNVGTLLCASVCLKLKRAKQVHCVLWLQPGTVLALKME